MEKVLLIGKVYRIHTRGEKTVFPSMIFTKMEPNVLKKLSNYNHFDTTYLFKPRLTVHVAFLRRHINSRVKALNRQDFFNTGFTMAC